MLKLIRRFPEVLLVTLVASGVVSCNKSGPRESDQSVTVSFRPGSLYEELGCLEQMAARISSEGGFVITDSLLVYDQEGKLVTKAGVESRSFEKKGLVLQEVPEGTYTLILWQTAYRGTDGLKAWRIGGEESLSTVTVTGDGSYYAFAWSVGVASAVVTVGDRAVWGEMTPVSIGSIIDATVDNIPEEKEYACVSLNTGEHVKGAYLNPSRKDKWIVEEGKFGIPVRLFPSDHGHNKFFTLVQGEDLTMYVRGDWTTTRFEDLGTVPHKALALGEHYTFYFDIARAGWQPAFFGSAEDFVAWKADRDAGILVFDPFVKLGSSLADVEEHVRRKAWWKDFDGTITSSERWYKGFSVSDSLLEGYGFATEDYQDLNQVFCHSFAPGAPIDMARALVLNQGYIYAGKLLFPKKTTAYDVFFSADNAVEVYIRPFDDGSWRIIYKPTDPDDLQYITKE